MPCAIDDGCVFEAAVCDAAGDFFPFADDASRPAWNARPCGSGDGLVFVDGFPGDDVEGTDFGGEGLEDVDGAAVVPLADRGDRQARGGCFAQVGQGEFDVLPGVR